LTKRFRVTTLHPQLPELRLRAQDNELRELDAVGTEFLAKLVKRGLDGRRLGDRMTAALGWHESSVAPV
jgi:hypothetical protein